MTFNKEKFKIGLIGSGIVAFISFLIIATSIGGAEGLLTGIMLMLLLSCVSYWRAKE